MSKTLKPTFRPGQTPRCVTGPDVRSKTARAPAVWLAAVAVATALVSWIMVAAITTPATGNIPLEKVWNFDDLSPGTLPRAFLVGKLFDGRPAGEWKVLITPRAKSASQVLAQLTSKGADQAHKLVLIEDTTSANVDVEVAFLAVSGKADVGGGLIWRAQDDRNYYLLRASAVEQNVRLYRVVKGMPRVVKTHNRPIGRDDWHTLRVMQHGCEMQVRYDNEPILQLCDQGLSQGRIGLWTPSDAVTYFDDLQFRVLE